MIRSFHVRIILYVLIVCPLFILLNSLSTKEAASSNLGNPEAASSVVHLFWHVDGVDTHQLGNEALEIAPSDLLRQDDATDVDTAQNFVNIYQDALQIENDITLNWVNYRFKKDDEGFSTVVLQQYYQGVPVFAAQLAVRVEDSDTVVGANGEYLTQVHINTLPKITEELALETAVSHLRWKQAKAALSELVIFNHALLGQGTNTNYLAYHFVLTSNQEMGRHEVFVDAHTGKILLEYSDIHEAKDRQIYDLANSYAFPGTPCYNEAGPIGTPSTDCEEAFQYTGDTYDYFFDTFGRDSFDDAGAPMIASVNYWYSNAYWDSEQTVYGTGFAKQDVVAHEWAHAVTEHTADLIYYGQSGALNESMSDVFGAMVDREDWLMGEDTPWGVIRSLEEPTLYGQPGKVTDEEYYCGYYDNGGVHYNSGIPNHAAYLMAEGGTYNGYTIDSIGRESTEQIFYHTLTHYLMRGSDFADAANAFNASCSDLYGGGSATCGSVSDALLAVEMATDASCTLFFDALPDEYEDDDTSATASSVVINDPDQLRNFHDFGDEDWVQFTAVNEQVYEIKTTYIGQYGRTSFELYDNNLNLITQDDRADYGYTARLIWRAPAAGDYYLKIEPYGYIYGEQTQYNFFVAETDEVPFEPDEFEPDDTYLDASTLGIGDVQTHNFHTYYDEDWIRFHP